MNKAAHRQAERPVRRLSGYIEVVFNIVYLLLALAAAVLIFSRGREPVHLLAGGMTLLLAGGDLFHLVPRIAAITAGDRSRLGRALGLGRMVTSITMTVFYILLWHLGLLYFPTPAAGWTALVYILGAARIVLCLLPQNGWGSQSPFRWRVLRNAPFVLLGAVTAALFGLNAGAVPALRWMALAIGLSFGFYLPVALGAGRYRMLGMLMLPKTCVYLWMLFMFTSL